MHRALAAVRDTGRFGDRKVFISSLWAMVLSLDAEIGSSLTDGATIEHFKAWLLRSRLLTCDGTADGAPLVVLARADLVAAMNDTLVVASETITDGASFHFVLDPHVARGVYAARIPANAYCPITRGRVGPSWHRIATAAEMELRDRRPPGPPRPPRASAGCRRVLASGRLIIW